MRKAARKGGDESRPSTLSRNPLANGRREDFSLRMALDMLSGARLKPHAGLSPPHVGSDILSRSY